MKGEIALGNYRNTYFKNTKSMFGKYQCCRCGKWFNKEDIDVDHKIAKRLGGSDELYNLQAMCRHCNRSKGANSSGMDIASSVIGAVISGNTSDLVGNVAKQKLKDALGIKYKRK